MSAYHVSDSADRRRGAMGKCRHWRRGAALAVLVGSVALLGWQPHVRARRSAPSPPVDRGTVPGFPGAASIPAGVTGAEWRGVVAQIQAERRAFHAASDRALDANGPGGENLLLGADGSAVLTVGRRVPNESAPEPKGALARVASVSVPAAPAVTLRLKPLDLGRGDTGIPFVGSEAVAVGRHRAERSVAEGVREWWRSEERGIEFGWDLATRPAGEGALRLKIDAACDWPAVVENGGRRVVFAGSAGAAAPSVALQELVVTDAAGHPVPAHMEWGGTVLSVVVEDADAAYPIRIDPWIAVGTPLTANSVAPVAGSKFGRQICLSGDVLAVTDAVSGVPTFHVFTRSGAGYVLRRSIPLHLPGLFGSAPAVVCGDTMVAGPFFQTSENHPKWIVMERNAGGPNAWSTVQEIELPEVATIIPGSFGSAALTADALVIGNPAETGTPQEARVKVHWRSRTNPSQWVAAAPLTGFDTDDIDFFGARVEMDGPTLVVSAAADTRVRLHFFRRGGHRWVFERAVEIHAPSDEEALLAEFDLSGDTLALNLPLQGQLQFFERDGGGPSQWGLVRSVPVPAFMFGTVDLDGDLAVTGYGDEAVDHDGNPATPDVTGAGVVRVFGRHAGGYGNWGLLAKLHKGSAAKADGHYGSSVALEGARLAVGYSGGDSVAPAVADAGVVELTTTASGVWSESAIHNPVLATSVEFGGALSVDGPYLLAGAPLYHPVQPGAARGVAFLFRDGTLVKTFHGETSGDHFGAAVAVQRDRVVIAAPLRPGSSNGVGYGHLGKIYIYERNQGGAENWGLVKAIVPDDVTGLATSPLFGASLALDGERLAVGSPEETLSTLLPARTYLGLVRVFERNSGGVGNWGQVRKLTGDDSGSAEKFGASVALEGEALAVGAPGEAVRGVVGAGVAYVFARNHGGAANWGRLDKVIASPVQAGAAFGAALALDGADLVVAAPEESKGAVPLAGAVYLFRQADDWDNAWSLAQRLQPAELSTAQYFGVSVAVDHGRLLVGGPLPVANEPSAAAAWLYTRDGAAGEPWALTKKFTTAAADSLGTVALDGLHVVVADPTEDVGAAADRGVIHVWDLAAAEFVPEAATPAAEGMTSFGASVALQGDLLAAGAPRETVGSLADAGAVYVLQRSGGSAEWELLQRLTDPDGAAADALFGTALAMDDRWLMVGVPGRSQARVYDRSSASPTGVPFGFLKTLTPSPAQTNRFGTSVALCAERVLVGAPNHNPGSKVNAGAAFLFDRNQGGADAWGQTKVLGAADAGAGDQFGQSLALNATTAVVGAPFSDAGGTADAGSAHVFQRNAGGADAWGQVKKLTAPAPAAGDEFGTSVALVDFLVLVGVPRSEAAGATDAGAAMLFARNFGGAEAYGLIKSFTAPDATAQARFGQSVALDTWHAVVGAPFADPGGRNSAGQIYVHSRNYGGTDSWGFLQTLCPTDVAAGAQFGTALALDRTRLAVGAPFNARGATTGSAEIYEFRGRRLYDEWLAAWALTGSKLEPFADADGDGQENLFEMALGSDPGDPASLGQLWVEMKGGNFVVAFPKCGLAGMDGVLSAEVSTDLSTWTPASPAAIVEDSGSFLRLEMPASGPARFVRFRLQLP